MPWDGIACPEMVKVRRAVPGDAAPVAAIHVRAWRVAYRSLMPDEVLDDLSVAKREQMWRLALGAEENPPVYVAVEDNVVLGFCAVAAPSRDDDADDRVAEIAAIYVEPDAWRTGVGQALMDVALTDLRAGGWRSVTLWVLAKNRQAREFYAQYGFTPDGAETTHEDSGEGEVRLRASITVE